MGLISNEERHDHFSVAPPPNILNYMYLYLHLKHIYRNVLLR